MKHVRFLIGAALLLAIAGGVIAQQASLGVGSGRSVQGEPTSGIDPQRAGVWKTVVRASYHGVQFRVFIPIGEDMVQLRVDNVPATSVYHVSDPRVPVVAQVHVNDIVIDLFETGVEGSLAAEIPKGFFPSWNLYHSYRLLVFDESGVELFGGGVDGGGGSGFGGLMPADWFVP